MNPFFLYTAHAQDLDKARDLLGRIERAVIDPLIVLAFLVALVVFFWGIIKFINGTSSGDQTAMTTGKSNIIWGVVGMTIMIGAYGILAIINGTVGGGQSLGL